MARRKSKQNMQKTVITWGTAATVGPGTEVVVADIIPDQEILVKRVILHATPHIGAGFDVGEANYILAVTESDNGVADPNDIDSATRLVRSCSGNINTINQIDTTLTMRKEGGSGVHAIIRAQNQGPACNWSGQLIIHYLEV